VLQANEIDARQRDAVRTEVLNALRESMTSVLVRPIPAETTIADVESFFSACEGISVVEIEEECALVTFKETAAAEAAIKLSGTALCGQSVEVCLMEKDMQGQEATRLVRAISLASLRSESSAGSRSRVVRELPSPSPLPPPFLPPPPPLFPPLSPPPGGCVYASLLYLIAVPMSALLYLLPAGTTCCCSLFLLCPRLR